LVIVLGCFALVAAATRVSVTVCAAEQENGAAGSVAPKGGDSAHSGENEDHESAADDPETSHGESGHGGDGHGSHDPTDLSHNDAAPELEDPSEFRSDLAIWTFVVFICLLGILLKFAWRPVMEGLEKREQSVAAMIEEAKQSSEKAAEQLRQYEARLTEASSEAQKILAQAQRDAEANKEEIVNEARTAAQRERQRAVADIEAAKNSALEEMTHRSVDLAMLMAGRIVQRQMNPEDQAKLIREALDQLPSEN
jgi:F-type H+-transporting ATPase subunit b